MGSNPESTTYIQGLPLTITDSLWVTLYEKVMITLPSCPACYEHKCFEV